MKSVYLLVLYQLFASVVAFGPKGGWERATYFYAYIAEETHKTSGWSVAPSCANPSRNVKLVDGSTIKRCSLAEFLHYIWAPDKDAEPPQTEKDRPNLNEIKANIGKKADTLTSLTPEKLAQAIMLTGMTGYSDSQRIMPGTVDYYDTLRNIGAPIQAAKRPAVDRARVKAQAWETRNNVPPGTNPPEAFLTKYERGILWRWPQDAMEVVTHLRNKDMDNYRINQGGLKSKFGGRNIVTKWTLATKTRTGLTTLPEGPYSTLDFDRTVAANGGGADMERQLTAANDAYLATRGHPANHNKAIKSAEFALASLNCDRRGNWNPPKGRRFITDAELEFLERREGTSGCVGA
ncbi:uncharacterized protein BCR38DRAFT_501556 [Pseudomassariella vexata]|uniref:Uncharacterized protein n=1 Tax=Pseudomassariella vexata TaxID=1141098 RepID=A0A1Y2DF27_9PEZI|nr:uncharacterized protein BCR38DRAFT_501556 [Pseudomassariella vexata]ORY57859.1 hypothetical protein BCR38DRAFT_501556 [Pseudomassariella vexata]